MQQEKLRYRDRIGSIGILINKKRKTEMTSLVDGGPQYRRV